MSFPLTGNSRNTWQHQSSQLGVSLCGRGQSGDTRSGARKIDIRTVHHNLFWSTFTIQTAVNMTVVNIVNTQDIQISIRYHPIQIPFLIYLLHSSIFLPVLTANLPKLRQSPLILLALGAPVSHMVAGTTGYTLYHLTFDIYQLHPSPSSSLTVGGATTSSSPHFIPPSQSPSSTSSIPINR